MLNIKEMGLTYIATLRLRYHLQNDRDYINTNVNPIRYEFYIGGSDVFLCLI